MKAVGSGGRDQNIRNQFITRSETKDKPISHNLWQHDSQSYAECWIEVDTFDIMVLAQGWRGYVAYMVLATRLERVDSVPSHRYKVERW